jgi:hypothetical protein
MFHIFGMLGLKILCFTQAGGSNLSHNHQLVPQSTVVDGRSIVNLESSLTPEEFNSIKERFAVHHLHTIRAE